MRTTICGGLLATILVWSVAVTFEAGQVYALDQLGDEVTRSVRINHHKTRRCQHLYAVNRHRAWSECMGVRYVEARVRANMNREDI